MAPTPDEEARERARKAVPPEFTQFDDILEWLRQSDFNTFPDGALADVALRAEENRQVEEAAEAARAAIVDVLEARDPKGSTDEDGEDDDDSDE